jgi:hypothetical protein
MAIRHWHRRALAFDSLSFASLDLIAHDPLLLKKRAGVDIVPPGANITWKVLYSVSCITP